MDLLQNCKIKYNEETKNMKEVDEKLDINQEDLDVFDRFNKNLLPIRKSDYDFSSDKKGILIPDYNYIPGATNVVRTLHEPTNNIVIDSNVVVGELFKPQPNKWNMYPFGKGTHHIMGVPYDMSTWKRFWFKFFLGIHFERI